MKLKRAALPALCLLACCQTSLALATEDDTPDLQAVMSNHMKDYMSDKRRVGSLVGSVLGGAMTVHPVGPVIGSLVGFMIGKRSMYEGESSRVESTPDRLSSIIPDSPYAAPGEPLSLTGSRPAPTFFQPETTLAPLAPEPLTEPPPAAPLATGPTRATAPAGIAQLCRTPAGRGNPACFYHSAN